MDWRDIGIAVCCVVAIVVFIADVMTREKREGL